MAISSNASILAMLKVWYKDGVENLLFRNSPVLKKLNKVRVEGKTQNFSAMYGRGGAVSADYTQALSAAASVSKNVEFAVAPGQVFSVYSINAKEVQASQTKRGAYMRVAGAKMFAATEGFRKTMAAALYGRGFGEIQAYGVTTALTAGTPVTLTFKNHAIMKIDIGSVLDLKASVTSTTVKSKLTVTAINGTSVTVTPDTSVAAPVATDVICLCGGYASDGSAQYPMGLGGWLPTISKRTGAAWNSYIGTAFYGVTRSVATDRLAGAFYDGTANASEKKSVSIQKLLQKVRRQGSAADMIIMNDEDFLDFSAEIESTNTFFTQTSTKAKKEAAIGFDGFAASFSTSYIENIIDDPYCPKGVFYILDSSAVEIWSYTNTDKIGDGIADNTAGKEDPMSFDAAGKENDPYALMIEDYLTIQPGSSSVDGPTSNVVLNLFGSFVVTNPSVNGVGIFSDGTIIE